MYEVLMTFGHTSVSFLQS